MLSREAASVALILFVPLPDLTAQELPSYRAINPMVAARTGLGFVPVRDLSRDRFREITLDYGSIVEVVIRSDAEYVLDAEILRLRATVGRRIGRDGFVQVSAGVGGAYDGFLDEPLNAYHDLIGLREGGRSQRPDNVFAYHVLFPDQRAVARPPSDGFLGDLTVEGGWQFAPHWQAALSVTLPTATGPSGYGVDAVASALTLSTRSRTIGDRLVFEAGTGVGFTPRAGELRDYQRTVFAAANGGLRIRFWGRQSAFANLFYHSPVYRRTTFHALDARELSIDVGFLFQPANGPTILAALTEDLEPRGPAVDVVFRLGARW